MKHILFVLFLSACATAPQKWVAVAPDDRPQDQRNKEHFGCLNESQRVWGDQLVYYATCMAKFGYKLQEK